MFVYDGQRDSVPGKPIAKAVTMNAMNKLAEVAATTWAAQVPEVVDDRYLDYVLTFPLPPLAGRDWVTMLRIRIFRSPWIRRHWKRSCSR